MKFEASYENLAKFRKKKIKTRLYETGVITLYEVREMFNEKPDESDHDVGWFKETALMNKIRVRETKQGWFVYLPEPVKIPWDEEGNMTMDGERAHIQSERTQVEIVEELINLRKTIENAVFKLLNWSPIRLCIVKAKKSGRKEERQDRKAKFHRWVNLSKGVQQTVALVEFEDGHIEQVQPERIIFIDVDKPEGEGEA